jgi:hypothetical protein
MIGGEKRPKKKISYSSYDIGNLHAPRKQYNILGSAVLCERSTMFHVTIHQEATDRENRCSLKYLKELRYNR